MNETERDFWVALEYRISREFEGFEDRHLRYFWCDGLIPEVYDLQGKPPTISGRAYCGQSGQEHWQFTLFLAGGSVSAEEVDWPSLVPPEEATGWLSPHVNERRLLIEVG